MVENEELLIEFTSTKDHEDSLRMEVLVETGHVNLFGPLTYQGTRNTGRCIQIQNKVVLKEQTLRKLRCAVIDRINRKVQKNYGPTHVLVVTFDDFAVWSGELEQLRSGVQSEIDLSALPFGGLYLLGLSRGTLCPLREVPILAGA